MAGFYAFWQDYARFGEAISAAFPTHSGCYKPATVPPI
jgi:hypothetical protein